MFEPLLFGLRTKDNAARFYFLIFWLRRIIFLSLFLVLADTKFALV